MTNEERIKLELAELKTRSVLINKISPECREFLCHRGIFPEYLSTNELTRLAQICSGYKDAIDCKKRQIVTSARKYFDFLANSILQENNINPDAIWKEYLLYISGRVKIHIFNEYLVKIEKLIESKYFELKKYNSKQASTEEPIKYEAFLSIVLLRKKSAKMDDVFINHVLNILLGEYCDEENFLRFCNYFEWIVSEIYSSVYYRVKREYEILCEEEKEIYRKTPEYWALREKKIQERRKYIGKQSRAEALNDELEKLDIWTANTYSSDPHISYHKKATTQNWGSSWNYDPVGFVPSCQLNDLLKEEANKHKDKLHNEIVQYICKLLKEDAPPYKHFDDINGLARKIYANNHFRMSSIIFELCSIFGGHVFPSHEIASPSSKIKLRNINTNEVREKELTALKESYPYLGRKQGDVFVIPGEIDEVEIIKICL